MLNNLLWLQPFLLIWFVNGQIHGPVANTGAYTDQVLNEVKATVDRIIPPARKATKQKDGQREVYHQAIWDEPAEDFYHPYTFNVLDGNKQKLIVESIFEDRRLPVPDGLPPIDFTSAEVAGVRVLAWSSRKTISVQWTTRNGNTVLHKELPGVKNLDELTVINPFTNDAELYLLVLSDHVEQKVTVLRLGLENPNITTVFELPVDPDIAMIRHVEIHQSKRHLVVAARYLSTKNPAPSMTSSDVLEATFINGKLFFYKLDSILTSGAKDVEPFTINGVTYLAVADSHCAYSDIFVFDADVNGFHLYQRLSLLNATDFEYFRIGFRHFVAGIGFNKAVIFEWEGERLVNLQEFKIEYPSVHPDPRRWHSLNTGFPDQALLLLVRSFQSVELVTWSKMEGRFRLLENPACLSWFHYLDAVGSHVDAMPQRHQDIFGAKMECSWAGDQCFGVTEISRPEGKSYVLELGPGATPPIAARGFTFWQKQKLPGLSCFMDRNAIGLGRIISYRVQGSTYAVIPFETFTATVVFILRKVRTEHFSTRASLLESLNKSQKKIEAQELYLHQLNSTDKPLTIVTVNGNEKIEDVTFDTNVTASNILAVENLKFSNSYGDAKMGQYEGVLSNLDRLIREILRRLEDAVPIHKPVNISGDLSFSSMEVNGQIIARNGARIGKINGVNVMDFVTNAVSVDQMTPVYGQKTFAGPVRVHGNMVVNGLVAGHNFPEDILTTNSEQGLKGLWKFNHPINILEEISVGQLNGVDMNKVVTIPTAPNKTRVLYPAKINFLNSLIVEGDIIAQTVDGIDLEMLAPTLVTLKNRQIITAPKVFQKNVHVIGDVNLHKTVNGFSLPLLDASVVKSDQRAEITGHKIFKDNVFIDESMFVNGLLKEYAIPDDFVLNNTTATISGKKTFTKQLIVKQNVFVDEFIAGIPSSALVTLYSQQTIPDMKIFTGGIEFTNLDVVGKIDGMTVEELEDMHSPNYKHPIAPTEFDSVTLMANLSNIDSINGYSVDDLHKDTVLKGEMDVLIYSPKIFEETATVTRVHDINTLNSLNLRSDFLRDISPQMVIGRKTFNRRVVFTKGLEIKGLLDGIDVTEFGLTTVTLSTVQEIRGMKTFTNGITANGQAIVGLVDSVAIPEQLVLPQNFQPVVGKKTFIKGLRGTNLIVGNLNLRGNLNHVNWANFMSRRVALLSTQDIIVPLNFAESVLIHGNLDVTGTINAVNVHQLVSDVMRKSVAQTVTGPKTVLGLVQGLSTVTSKQGLDGVNLAKLSNLIIPVNNDIISSSYSFPELSASTELKVNGQLGPLDLEQLIKDSVRKLGPPQHITASKTFNDGITITGDLKVERVNNIDITKSVLSKTLAQQITGAYELIGQVVLEKDLHVVGKINKLDVVEFNDQVMKTDQSTSTNVLTFEDDLRVEFNLDVDISINGVFLPELVENAVLKIGSAKITAVKRFIGELAVNVNVEILRNVNGFSLSAFASDLVFVMGEQVITSPKHFSNLVLDGDLMAAGNLRLKGKIEDVSLPELLGNAVLLNDNRPIHGNKVFLASLTTRNVVAMGTLNSIRFPQEVVTTNGPQNVNGIKHFHRIIVETNVNGEKVNNHNLLATAQDTFLLIGDQAVKGVKTLQQMTTFKSAVDIYGQTCGLDFQKQLVTLNSNQEILGEKTIHHVTVTKLAQIDKINGNILGPLTDIWRINEKSGVEHHFLGHTKFNHPVTITAPMANVDVLKAGVRDLDAVQKRLLSGLGVAQKHCTGYSEIMNPLQHAAIKLHHFDDVQSLDVLSSAGFSSWMVGNQLHMIASHGEGCHEDALFVWNDNAGIFTNNGHLGTRGKSGHWHAFIHNGQRYLAVSDWDSSCGSTSKIWHYNVAALRYEAHCHLNMSASQMTTLQFGEDFYLVVGHMDSKSQILLMDLSQNCRIIKDWNIFPESSLVTVVESLHLVIFSNALSSFSEVFRLMPQKEFESVQRLETPWVKDILSISSLNEHFVVLNRKQYPSKWTKPMDTVQIYKASDRSTEPMTLIKEIPSEILREVLDLDVFNFGPRNEPYLVILHKKTGVMITPLFGLLTYDGVELPMPQAKKMHAFTIQGRPYIVLNQVDPRRQAHVFRGYLEGTSVRDVIKC